MKKRQKRMNKSNKNKKNNKTNDSSSFTKSQQNIIKRNIILYILAVFSHAFVYVYRRKSVIIFLICSSY